MNTYRFHTFARLACMANKLVRVGWFLSSLLSDFPRDFVRPEGLTDFLIKLEDFVRLVLADFAKKGLEDFLSKWLNVDLLIWEEIIGEVSSWSFSVLSPYKEISINFKKRFYTMKYAQAIFRRSRNLQANLVRMRTWY